MSMSEAFDRLERHKLIPSKIPSSDKYVVFTDILVKSIIDDLLTIGFDLEGVIYDGTQLVVMLIRR